MDGQASITSRGRPAHARLTENLSAGRRSLRYGRCNLVEAAFSRVRRVHGDRLRSRSLDAHGAEIAIGVRAINRRTDIGMPITRRVV